MLTPLRAPVFVEVDKFGKRVPGPKSFTAAVPAEQFRIQGQIGGGVSRSKKANAVNNAQALAKCSQRAEDPNGLPSCSMRRGFDIPLAVHQAIVGLGKGLEKQSGCCQTSQS